MIEEAPKTISDRAIIADGLARLPRQRVAAGIMNTPGRLSDPARHPRLARGALRLVYRRSSAAGAVTVVIPSPRTRPCRHSQERRRVQLPRIPRLGRGNVDPLFATR